MRWADLDSLNHVNNVVYLNYAAESRARMVDDGLVGEATPVSGMTVRFVRPLPLGRRPVVVVSDVDGDTLTQQICVDEGDDRTVFAEVVTRHGEPQPTELREDVHVLPSALRRSDLDASGEVTATKVFELFQEARVFSIATRLDAFKPGSFVVGTADVTFHRPIRWRPEPCVAGVWVSRVGGASFDIGTQLSDDTGVLATSRTVLVGFDPTTQRSKPFDEPQRAQLEALMTPNSPC